MIKDSINFGSKTIEYNLIYSDRKTLGITITPNMDVVVKAPIDADIEKIKAKVVKKAPWILKQQSYFLAFYPKTTKRKFISGETHLYLGRNYKLKVNDEKLKPENEKREVIFDRGIIVVFANDSIDAEKKLNKWYKQKSIEKIRPIAETMFEKFISKHKLENDKFLFSFRNMPTRWGSCTAKGRIILNVELIKAPKTCIEYVIVHELCHLIYHDHTNNFIDLQTKEMPDWEKWKNKLEKLLA